MYPHRLPELDEPDQEKPVANQDLADVIIEEIVDEQQASGGSAFVACVSKISSSLSIFSWMFVVLQLSHLLALSWPRARIEASGKGEIA